MYNLDRATCKKSTVNLHFIDELTADTDFVAYFQFLTTIKGFDAKPIKLATIYHCDVKMSLTLFHCKDLFLKNSVALLPDYRGSS